MNDPNRLVKILWEDIVSSPTPTAISALWDEHKSIRRLLEEIDAVNYARIRIFASRENRLEMVDNFLRWADRLGIQANGVTVGRCRNLEGAENYEDTLGLIATSDINEGQCFLKVPRCPILSWDDANKSPIFMKLFEQDPIIQGMDNVTLALMLACELLKDSDSRWAPYLQILPSSFSTPLYFTEQELELLRPSPIFEQALKIYRAIARQFVYFHIIVQRNEAQKMRKNTKEKCAIADPLLEKSPLTTSNFTFDLYKWAVACVSTRINRIPSQIASHPDGRPIQVPALIPFMDMANHSFGVTDSAISVHFCMETQQVGCSASDNYHFGDDVPIFYGFRTNGEHLLHNGFVPDKNSADRFRLKLGLSKTDKNIEFRVNTLRSYKLNPTEIFEISPNQPPLPNSLVKFAEIFVADDFHQLGTTDNSIKAWKFLADRLRLLLKGHSLAISKMSPSSFHQKSILALIASELKILEIATDYASTKLTESMYKGD